MHIRTAKKEDLDMIAAVEAECFPPKEAASREEFEKRLEYYKDHFWLMTENGRLVAFLDGFVTDEPDITDDMYSRADMHNRDGRWQMIFGVNTLPAYRGRGYAGELIKRAISDAKKQGRLGLVLTCKEPLLNYYARFGFVSEGLSEKSRHGGAEWYQMRLVF